MEGQLGFADGCLKGDIFEEHLTFLDPRRGTRNGNTFSGPLRDEENYQLLWVHEATRRGAAY